MCYSPRKAWKRFYDKQSPSKKVILSPICPSKHLIKCDFFHDYMIIRPLIWTVLNTEEFYYQNIGSLVHNHSKNTSELTTILKDHRNVIEWQQRLKNYTYLGRGSFGNVYEVTDTKTNIKYALKVINSPTKECDQKALYAFLRNLLVERNIFSELNESLFFVRMLSAFQSSDRSQFMFVLEICICDLSNFLSLYDSPLDYVSNFQKSFSFKLVSFVMNYKLQINYEQVIFIYIFEMLCALHYLASRHVIHADIKPENVLLSLHGHVKFSDFGVSFKNDWFHRDSIVLLPSTIKEMEEADAQDKNASSFGTSEYFDPELLIKEMDSNEFYRLRADLPNKNYLQQREYISQNFLSDLYAVGLIAIELITGGIQINEISNSAHFNIKLIYHETLRKNYLVEPLLKMSKKKDTKSVFKFILSIFLPRPVRAKMFTSKVVTFKQNERVSDLHIDIKRVENILYYKSNSITKENVLNIHFPEIFLLKLFKNSKHEIELDNENSDIKYYNLHPFDYCG